MKTGLDGSLGNRDAGPPGRKRGSRLMGLASPPPPTKAVKFHAQSRKSANNAEQPSRASERGKWKLTSHIFFPLRGSQTAERVPEALWES
ncbi:unnamed protein product [Rangifer tarandus platyrhynchus]|uniref:Uncharacterized protein n=1 Tax=Rangifer tarandus platyrhynchus TaxID=3082113 RepID=A0AC59ZWL2_RANTA